MYPLQKGLLLFVLACAFDSLLPAWSDTPGDSGFSPWMDNLTFRQWKLDNVKGRHLYCPIVEGRLNNGVVEYRTKPEPFPTGFQCMVYTFRHLDEAHYHLRVDQFSHLDGFKQIWVQSFIDAQGLPRYQTVFLKLTKKEDIGNETPGAPSPPALPPQPDSSDN